MGSPLFDGDRSQHRKQIIDRRAAKNSAALAILVMRLHCLRGGSSRLITTLQCCFGLPGDLDQMRGNDGLLN
jgi:hypothetical protein